MTQLSMAIRSFSDRSILSISAILAFITLCIRADKELLCLVCNAVAEEVESEIRKVKPGHKVNVGTFRIDAEGNQLKNEIDYLRSETHLNDVLDNFCQRMDDYAEARYKGTGARTILKLTGHQGSGLHPDINNVDFLQDGDLNKKLKFYCETIVEEFEESIITIFSRERDDSAKQLCITASGFCDIDDDDEDRDEKFEEYISNPSTHGKEEL